jgi:hypothetical protein
MATAVALYNIPRSIFRAQISPETIVGPLSISKEPEGLAGGMGRGFYIRSGS